MQRPLTDEIPEGAFPGLAVVSLFEPAWDEALIGGDFSAAFTLPSGIADVEIYEARPLRLLPGETILMVTDGIAECPSAKTNIAANGRIFRPARHDRPS